MKLCKKFRIYILLVVMAILLSGCGNTVSTEPNKKSIAISDLQKSMLAADTTLPEMMIVSDADEQADLNFSYLSSLSYDMIDSYFYAYAKDGTAEEIAVIRLIDKGDAAAMMDSLHEHIKQRKGTFQEYAPEQVEMTQNAVVTRHENYIALIISKKNGMVQKTFEESFK